MSNLPIYNDLGAVIDRQVALDPKIFDIVVSKQAIYLDVKYILAKKRQGTHKTKEKSDLSGSTRKIRKQKGTGGARMGSIKSPLFKGGARIFGPVPRDYSFKLNKKVRKLARKSALSYKVKQNNNFFVLDFLSLEKPKTKFYKSFLKNFGSEEKKSLLICKEAPSEVLLASRNLPKAKVILARCVNTYDILNSDTIIMMENALSEISENLL